MSSRDQWRGLTRSASAGPARRVTAAQEIGLRDDLEMTFRPQISSRSKVIDEARTDPSRPRWMVLYAQRKTREQQEQRERENRRILAAKELAACTFKPETKITVESQQADSGFYERSIKSQERKHEKIVDLRHQYQAKELEECSFRPAVTPRAGSRPRRKMRPTSSHPGEDSFVERQYAARAKRAEHKSQLTTFAEFR